MERTFWDVVVALQQTNALWGVLAAFAVAGGLLILAAYSVHTGGLPGGFNFLFLQIYKKRGKTRLLGIWLLYVALAVGAIVVFKPIPMDAGLPPLQFQPSLVPSEYRGTMEQLSRIENAIIASIPERQVKPVEPVDVRTLSQQAQAAIDDKALIVFIHGWKGDEATFNKFPQLVSDDIAMQGFDTELFLYPVFILKRNLRVPDIAEVLRRQLLRSGADEKYNRIYLVAHSLGGVIARKLYMRNQLARNKLPIRGMLSLGSPYGGTNWGRLGSLLGVGGALTAELGSGAQFLVDLNADWEAAARDPVSTWWYCFASPLDAVVSQLSATTGCGSFSENFAAFGHVDMAKPESIADDRYLRVVGTILRDGRLD
ncbi:esterase/lipase family protein [Hoeflea alexandrii]|uniref:esterase/lipase family protein n=1 Tax=Hoeflea alexandrii TaxID=288436 RepID=UPI0022AF0B31|nr:hypothetical protein [Hoeflea alexandrii]MCZ4288293.1 hypothetical protein [Hoeflea alexandrii]